RTRCPLIGASRHRPPRRFLGRRRRGTHACLSPCFTLAGLPRLMAPGPKGLGSLDLLRLSQVAATPPSTSSAARLDRWTRSEHEAPGPAALVVLGTSAIEAICDPDRCGDDPLASG